jgi:hypothetical protein
MYRDCLSPSLWVQRFRDVLDANQLESNKSSLLPIPSILSTKFDTLEEIIDFFKKAIVQSILREDAVVVTERGCIGQGTNICRVGDLLCVLLGCNLSVILRPVEKHYEFIGEAYLHGIMHGEAIQAMEEGKVQFESFELH